MLSSRAPGCPHHRLCTIITGHIFATISSDGIVEARTAKSNELVFTWHAERSDETFQTMAISPDDSFLALAAEVGRTVCIFDLRSGQPHAILRPHCQMERRTHLISIGWQTVHCWWLGGAEAWDLDSGTCVWKYQSLRERMVHVAFLRRRTWSRAWKSLIVPW